MRTIAEQVEACRAGEHPRLIARLDSGWAVMGQSQLLPGYCLLLSDPIVPTLNDLDEAGRAAFLLDMARLGDATLAARDPRPLRINYEMLGNLDPSLHAHVVPRYAAEPEQMRTKAIWLYPPETWGDDAHAFDDAKHGPMRDAVAKALRRPERAKKTDLSPEWMDAVSFAARAHEGSQRKDGRTPYFAHPARVALVVRDLFGCADRGALVAALLHDVIEDTGVDFDEIAEEFGEEVASLVAALSKDARLPEETREHAYDEGLGAADWRARLVKMADVFDNLTDAANGGGDKKALKKMLARAERALALAAADAKTHPASARAAALLRKLAKEHGG